MADLAQPCLDRWAQEVLLICSHVSLDDVLLDLGKTRNPEETVNRIFDGRFLEGTARDPSYQVVQDMGADSSPPATFEDILSTTALQQASQATTRYYEFKNAAKVVKARRGTHLLLNNGPPLLLDNGTPLLLDEIATAGKGKASYVYFRRGSHSPWRQPSPSSQTTEIRDNDDVIDLSRDSPVRPVAPPPLSSQLSASSTVSCAPRARASSRPVLSLNLDSDDNLSLDAVLAGVGFSSAPSTGRGIGDSSRAPRASSHVTAPSAGTDDFSIAAINARIEGSRRSNASGVEPEIRTEPPAASDTAQTASASGRALDDDDDMNDVAPSRGRKRRKTDEEKAAEKLEKERQTEQKRLEKERAKMEKEREKMENKSAQARGKKAKEAEKLEKQARRTANVIRDKNICVKEMVIEIDRSFAENDKRKIASALEEAGATVDIKRLPGPLTLRWRRRVDRKWNPESEAWDPIPVDQQRIEDEGWILVFLAGVELARIAAAPGGIARHCAQAQSAAPGDRIIYFIEGLDEYYKEQRKGLAMSFKRAANPDAPLNAQQRRTEAARAEIATLPNKEKIEDQLVGLSIDGEHRIMVHHSGGADESIDWIKSFTMQIGMNQELSRRNESAFSLSFGDDIKSGTNHADTWEKMLSLVNGITPAKARTITARYPTLHSLRKAYDACPNSKLAKELLADIPASSAS
ncbi:hypothetical protein BDK51DRAFT_29782 [Blyttiomyces helicus]|uniref:ERCC4 domain-containing protein n=1 Tax=Blyttiomyces helicus TaxID=388810 RepID=A0A4P9WJY3_9FUNG|nr:hypothetical protein BDK51DRAFT_29782 [Blyttiomyces helicus]|eukprot:RKO93094.1 hypothetical protein BDK51DRAFT_29782 [Blyttiomyces helicus]